VLLRKLQQSSFFSQISHIIVDEVHERQVEIDFLLTILKNQAPHSPGLRVILMSATMQELQLSNYFFGCPVLTVPGRRFPVTVHYLSDIDRFVAFGQRMKVETIHSPHDNDEESRGKKNKNKKKSSESSIAKSTVAHSDHSKRASTTIDTASSKPPQFDAERIAEIILRIISVFSRKDSEDSRAILAELRRRRQSRLEEINAGAAAAQG
jgi:hypothetical protein